MKNTVEQNDIILSSTGTDNMLIEACAGSGKSTTLRLIGEANPDKRGLYICFNKSAAVEAQRKMPSNITCKTTHSLAYAAFGGSIRHKLSRPRGGYRNVAGTAKEIASYFHVPRGKVGINPIAVARIARVIVTRFETSAEFNISNRFLPDHEIDRMEKAAIKKGKKFNKTLFKKLAVETANDLWAARCDIKSPVLAYHNTYLKMYQLSKPVLGYDLILLDEAQDSMDAVIDIVMNQTNKNKQVIVCGDSYQNIYCQPAGTMVTTIKDKRQIEVPIEDIIEGDMVLSYSVGKSHLFKNGKRVSRVGSRNFSGNMITVSTGQEKSSYTHDHHCLVRLGHHNDNKFSLYMAKNASGQFRVGICPWASQGESSAFGVMRRAAVEGAIAYWILGVYETKAEARLHEELLSYRHNIPQTCFKQHSPITNTILDIKGFWESVGDNSSGATQALSMYGKFISYPIWEKGRNLSFRSAFQIKACNILEGMEVCVNEPTQTHGHMPLKNWKPAMVSTIYENCKVYSLEVEDSHTYFADGILTHNCWNGAVNALQKLDFPRKRLSKSFRFGPEVAKVATLILDHAMVVEGNESIASIIGDVDKSMPYTILFRTNMELIREAFHLFRDGISVALDANISGFLSMTNSMVALRDGDMKKVKHEEVVIFDCWADLKDEAKDVGGDLALIAKLVESDDLEPVLSFLESYTKPSNPHVTLSTAHKSKGAEWPQVKLADDFPKVYDDDGKWIGLTDEERNLLYVAATRGMHRLEINSTLHDILVERGYYLTLDNQIDEAFDKVIHKEIASLPNL